MANRFKFIDGLRGIAACQVVLLHYCAAFLPTMARVGGSPHYAWEWSITRSPFFVVLHYLRAKPNAQAALLIRMVEQFPDMLKRMETV